MATTNEISLAVPVVNSQALSRGGYVRFFIERPAKATRYTREKLAVSPACFVLQRRDRKYPQLCVPIPTLSRPQAKRAAQILNGIAAAIVAIWPSCQFGMIPNWGNVESMVGLIRLYSWTLSTYAGCGENRVAEALKAMASWSRYLAGDQLYDEPAPIGRFPFVDSEGRFAPEKLLTGSIARKAFSRTSLLRLSRLSRALPPGGKQSAEAALADHRSILTGTAPAVDRRILRHFRTVARAVTQDRICGLSDASMDLSASACLERCRKRGGAMSFLRTKLWDLYPDTWCRIGAGAGDEAPSAEFERELAPISGLPWEVDYVRDRFQQVMVASANDMGVCDQLTRADRPWSCGWGIPEEDIPRVPSEIDLMTEGHPRRPVHVVNAIPDRGGFKTRVVTAGPAALNALAQTVRRKVYRSVLMRTPTKWGLIDGGVKKFFAQVPLDAPHLPGFGNLGGWVLLSSDLSAATDRFPHPVVEAINDGIESRLSNEDRRSNCWVAWRSLSGPQILHYGGRGTHTDPPYSLEGEKECMGCVESTCGNLMGTVPSWTHLNLYNLTAIRLAWSLWLDKRFRRTTRQFANLSEFCQRRELNGCWDGLKGLVLKTLRSAHPTMTFPQGIPFARLHCLVGDDLGAYVPWAVAILYEIVIELTNGKLSVGKHYVQPAVEGGFLLIAEEFAVVRSDRLVHIEIEHLRGVANAITPATGNDQPTWAQSGRVLDSSLQICTGSAEGALRRKALLSLAHIALADLRIAIQKHGLPLYLPTHVGGLGWPHPRGLTYGVCRLPIRCLLHYHALRGFRSDPIRFACEIAKTSCLWRSSKERNHMGPIVDAIRGYLSPIPVSHTEAGVLDRVRPDAPIGLFNPDLPEEDQHPLVELIRRLGAAGVAVRYLVTEPFDKLRHENAEWFDQLLHSHSPEDAAEILNFQRLPRVQEIVDQLKDDLTIKAAAKSYRHRTSQLLGLRRGGGIRTLPRASYEVMFAEDKGLLDGLHVLRTEDLESTYPYIFGPSAGISAGGRV